MYTQIDFEKWLDTNVNKYEFAIVDPPWNYNDKRPSLSVKQLTYNLWDNMKLKDIFQKINTDYLFLWTTNSMLPLVFECCKDSDYEFKVVIPWIKLTNNEKLCYGLGNSLRNCVEYLVLFQKPKAQVLRLSDRNIIFEQSGERTIKPKIWEHELVEKLSNKGLRGVYIFSGGDLDFIDSVDIVDKPTVVQNKLF